MKGGRQKMDKSKPKRTPTKRATRANVSPEAKDKSNAVPDNALPVSSLPPTPKRRGGQREQPPAACLTSTPVRSSPTGILSDISKSPSRTELPELEYTELYTELKTSEINTPRSKSNSRTRGGGDNASRPMQLRKRVTKEQTCIDANGSPAKQRRGRPQKDITTKSSEHSRPRFQLDESDEAEKASEKDESLLSSDLSIELSHHEEQLLSLSVQEDGESDEEEEEEELPSFLMQGDKKPPSIIGGVFVWHKLRNDPFWPALVKRVNQKQKKASILFIDDPIIRKKTGFTVPLKTLKPFDCEEADDLVRKAKEKYNVTIEWSLELITDYRIRIACGSFSGSFIEYFEHDMSYPVRRKYPQAASERLSIADPMLEVLCDDCEEDSFSEQQEEVSRSSKRLLPDRSHAAYNRANEKLVHFIVQQRMVEERLLAVIRGQQQSRWLRSFLSANRRRVINIYLEDDQQLERVYRYLNELYSSAMTSNPCLAEVKSTESVSLVLDVLLPEAIIYAIAGVEAVSVKKAEEKYLKGRCVSNRERQEFEAMIDVYMRRKSLNQNTPPALSPEAVG
ncbi:PWWP domain-containing DNA repair factor 3B-like isoform X1 [Notolabrus celidotus]|uniref:PWWP domain-containing DNA repair factor 3B-like isoform X1 n=1 Tax=Notolabrus celidotus TaxID=1203425 RepID=UPI00149069D7|nr:PWWP domain-containing DNA repair factor 3B-like isoform X1 [Notolabrus celidotus]XP_034536021.1 PWWP domain-containing DNA repair factor 3B-like isoform X1 [Notolabrus celidotus]XP_034536022.1 PWWP domain-containing DNA repair factor 3B-like isoform X1 [Notolabrus celidotus]XP_034536023.1 PWWP domain-containing DNA repair factor 3B-like isoform X1 [Notolabrus celidotus]XP_034536024.1 PWWP domain-containing DNA repair factor 3B-like isoform X1 [Notolabrus celidotus]XP_034536025.1 PWWP domai